jgi:hypothetical protein
MPRPGPRATRHSRGFDPTAPLLRSVDLHGAEAVIVWGYQTAATVTAWRVVKARGAAWRLSATLGRSHDYLLRQVGLSFNVPRRGGWFHWPLTRVVAVTAGTLTGELGPPEA